MKTTLPTLICAAIFVSAVSAQGPDLPRPHARPFRHVVVIFQENRTPDNLFYGLCSPPYGSADSCSATPERGQYNIQTERWYNVKSPTGFTNPEPIPLANAYDLSHSHSGFTVMCDANPFSGECLMDDAADVPCSGQCPVQAAYKFVDNSTGLIDPYLDLATRYGWANYMFQTNQGPSFPAHQFIFGGTSAPTAADDAAGIFAAENMSKTGISGTSAVAGCIAASTTTVQLIGPDGIEDPTDQTYPCFEHKTIPDILPSRVTWRYYTPGAGSIWTAPNAIQHICESSGPNGVCQGELWTNYVDLKPADVLTDIASCNLRDLSWVIPSGLNSDHAKGNDGGGPSWVASIVNAIGSSSCEGGKGYWKDTAIFITWDDWGGWYDHVAPPRLPYPQGGYQLGFRVPLLIVSAYTPEHYINNETHDFGSILRFIEDNFSVRRGALHFADARAENDLKGFFDRDGAARAFKPIAAPRGPSFFINDKRAATDPDDE